MNKTLTTPKPILPKNNPTTTFLPTELTQKMVTIGNTQLGEFPLLLAPMEDVSDPPFRWICKQHGADMLYTEFISSEGLIRNAEKSTEKLDIYDEERPIGIQIFGAEIQAMQTSARIVERYNPNLLDINYGCPVKNVVCNLAGAGILQHPDKMVQLTQAIVKSTHLPVTVKTRLGWDENTKHIVQTAEKLQDIGVKAISIHGRTRQQMYKGNADWTLIAEVKNNPRMTIPIFGNGDVDSPEKALEMKNKYGVDGIMIGRAAIGYPFIFNEIKHYFKTGTKLPPPTTLERVQTVKEYIKRAVLWKGEQRAINEARRHYTNYFKGFPNIKDIRLQIVTTNSLSQIFDLLDLIAQNYQQLDTTNINNSQVIDTLA